MSIPLLYLCQHGVEAPVQRIYQTPSLDILRKWDRLILGISTEPVFFLVILVVFDDSDTPDCLTVTEPKL